jgi:hypothetical protein
MSVPESHERGGPMAQRYKVIVTGLANTSLHHLLQKGLQLGINQAVFTAAETIHERLATAPSAFGEATHRLVAMKLIVHSAIVPPLSVTFGIHEELPLVFINQFKALPRSGLED